MTFYHIHQTQYFKIKNLNSGLKNEWASIINKDYGLQMMGKTWNIREQGVSEGMADVSMERCSVTAIVKSSSQ